LNRDRGSGCAAEHDPELGRGTTSWARFAPGFDRPNPKLFGARAREVARILITRSHAPERYEEGLIRIQAGVTESGRVIAQLIFDEGNVRLGPAVGEKIGTPLIDPSLDSLSSIHAHDSRPSSAVLVRPGTTSPTSNGGDNGNRSSLVSRRKWNKDRRPLLVGLIRFLAAPFRVGLGLQQGNATDAGNQQEDEHR
jgi:hypothetical protein